MGAWILAGLVVETRAAETFAGYAYYLGDPHAHTGYSNDGGSTDLGNCDGTCGSFADVFDNARAAGLDFLALTDHINGHSALEEDEFDVELAAVLAAQNDGLVTLPAAEVWFTLDGADLGHKTLLLFGDDAELATLRRADLQPRGSTVTRVAACAEIGDWMAALSAKAGPALLAPHHTAMIEPMPTDWTCHQAAWEPTVEMYSAHGNSLTADAPYDPPWSGVVAESTVHHAMDPGGLALRMGFIAGTDSHDTLPGGVCGLDTERFQHPYGGGLTVVVLPESAPFDRPAIHDAIVARRTYATTGPLVPVAVRYESGGAVLGGLGDEVGLPTGQPLRVTIAVPTEWASFVLDVRLVGPDDEWTAEARGAAAWTVDLAPGESPAWLYPAIELDGGRYYPSGCDDGSDTTSEWIWVSPSWIDPASPDLDGDGTAWADGDCDDGDPGIGPQAPERWYDGIDQDCDGVDDDQDGDGFALEVDCDDVSPEVHPGATEVWYDGIDQDCDANDDDQDGDGHALEADCDDLDPAIRPGAEEVWYDGVDQDCDGNDADRDGDGIPGPHDCDDADPRAECEAPTPGFRGCGAEVGLAGLPGGAWAAALALALRRRGRPRPG